MTMGRGGFWSGPIAPAARHPKKGMDGGRVPQSPLDKARARAYDSGMIDRPHAQRAPNP